jgi:hypothetical protein
MQLKFTSSCFYFKIRKFITKFQRHCLVHRMIMIKINLKESYSCKATKRKKTNRYCVRQAKPLKRKLVSVLKINDCICHFHIQAEVFVYCVYRYLILCILCRLVLYEKQRETNIYRSFTLNLNVNNVFSIHMKKNDWQIFFGLYISVTIGITGFCD